MFKLLVSAVYINFVYCSLQVPQSNDNVKKCVKNILYCGIDAEATVFYIYSKVAEDIFPVGMQNPFLTIDVNKKIRMYNSYNTYNEIVILKLDNITSINHYTKNLDIVKRTQKRKYIIMYPLKNVNDLNDIFFYFFSVDISNIIVMVYDFTRKNDTVRLFTWDPYHPSNKCGAAFNVREHTCNCSSLRMIQDQNKLQTYNKCNVTYFCSLNRLCKRYESEVAYVSTFIFDVIQEHLNVTVFHKQSARVKGVGLTMELRNLWICRSYHLCTVTFSESGNIWTVPPPKTIGALDAFKIIFKTNVWFLILLSFLITSFVWWIISWCSNGTGFTYSVLMVYSLTIFGYVDKLPRMLSLRCVFIAYIIYAIHIQSIVTSNFIKILTITQFEPSIQTLEELANSDVPLFISDNHYGYFSRTEPNCSLYSKIKYKLQPIKWNNYISGLKNTTALKRHSFFIDITLFFSMVQTYKMKTPIIVDNTLFGMTHHSLVTYGSSFFNRINKMITILLESGLLDLKKHEFKRDMSKFEHYYTNNEINTEAKVVLTLDHVYPVFVFWGIGLTFATAVFVIEVINLKKHEFKRDMSKFEHYYTNNEINTEAKVVLTLDHVYPVFVFWGIGLTFATAVFVIEVISYYINKNCVKSNFI
ncbi:hypothetical protein FQA39_LY11450 [Lamprigera yunnana]|nr:hypothetical protein FQA39_LY11450 [Lamprigera yunnana]